MLSSKNNTTKLFKIITPILAVIISICLCILLYIYDNKYYQNKNQAQNGVLILEYGLADQNSVTFLVDGWEYYSNKLLTPTDIKNGKIKPDEYIFIGQYGGFDRQEYNSPHGSATYRMQIILPEEKEQYQLNLPEIFSAYTIYINGNEISSMGNPNPKKYCPEVGNKSIVFEASSLTEIVIAVSDYTHIYSGIVYPPAFGRPDDVTRIFNTKLIFRSFLFCSIAIIGIMSLLFSVLSKKVQALQYTLLCIFCLGYTGYPIWQVFINKYSVFYMIENISFCAILLLLVIIVQKITQNSNSILMTIFGIFMLALTIFVHITLPFGILSLINIYSAMISIYKWMIAGFLTVTILLSQNKNTNTSIFILAGVLVFDTMLVMDRLLPLYEPVVFGWFIEISVLVLVFCIGVSICYDISRKYLQNLVLKQQVLSTEKILKMQKNYYAELSKQSEKINTIHHDLRHHFMVMEKLLKEENYAQLILYLSDYSRGVYKEKTSRYCDNDIVNIIVDYYDRIARSNKIKFNAQIEAPAKCCLPDIELSTILSNLLENAVDACLCLQDSNMWIDIYVNNDDSVVAIYMKNSSIEKDISKSILSEKEENRKGYGLSSVKSIVNKYNGNIDLHYEKNTKEFITTLFINF